MKEYFGYLILIVIFITLTLFRSRQRKKLLAALVNHLRTRPQEKVTESIGYAQSELTELIQAIQSLPVRIKDFERRASEKAAADAKIIIVRQLGHDLRTPLSQIAKYAYLIEHDPSKCLPDEDPRMEGIKKGLTRMGDLIRQIKELKSSVPQASVERSIKGEAVEVIRSIWKMDDIVTAKQLRLSIIENNSQIFAKVTSIHLFQILDNLLQNAIRAISEKQDGMVTILFDEDREGSTLTVSDNGVGISEVDLGNIWSVDYTTKSAKGTGLGLPIVRQICDDNRLKVEVNSKVGNGTAVRITFPKVKNLVDTSP